MLKCNRRKRAEHMELRNILILHSKCMQQKVTQRGNTCSFRNDYHRSLKIRA